MKWITKPNYWYDTLNNTFRFYILLGIYAVLVLLPLIIFDEVGYYTGLFLFGLIAIYRVIYFIIDSHLK